MRAVAIVCILLLAGCLGGADTNPKNDPRPPQDDTPPAPTGPGTDTTPEPRLAMLLDFAYEECDGQRMRVPLDTADIDAVLPEGYAAADDGGGTGTAEYLWMACDRLTTPNSVVNDTVYGHVAVHIEAPANATDASEHWYLLRMLSAPGTLEQVWDLAGYDVYAGDYSDTEALPAPLPLAAPRTIALGDYSVSGDALTGNGAPQEYRGFYTETDSGRLEWTGTLDVTETSGFGTLSVAEGDPLPQSASAQPTDGLRTITGALSGNDLWLVRQL